MEVSGLMVHVVSSRIMVGASSVASDISGDDAVELLMNARITIVHRSSTIGTRSISVHACMTCSHWVNSFIRLTIVSGRILFKQR